MSTPTPGWYADPQDQSRLRYWDGGQWTDQTRPSDTTPTSSTLSALGAKLGGLIQQGTDAYQGQKDARAATETAQGIQCRFEAQVAGTNATVTVYNDRIEYMKPKDVSGGKIAAAVMTGGLSLLATGVTDNKSGGTAVIPTRQITSVTSRNDGLRYSVMSITTAGATLDFRSSKSDIARAMPIIMRLVNSGGQPVDVSQSNQQQVVVNVTAPATPPASISEPTDVHEQLLKLKSLLDAGVLTQEEYDTKRSALVAQL